MSEDVRIIIHNWGFLSECPACGEEALQSRMDNVPVCMYCGYEDEGEDND